MRRLSRWLRVNAEHHLLRDAQARVARSLGVPEPPPAHGSAFWTRVFVPVYRITPWAVRRRVMTALPGSHRQEWPVSRPPEGPAV